jgi:hypothetical protein
MANTLNYFIFQCARAVYNSLKYTGETEDTMNFRNKADLTVASIDTGLRN